MKYLVFDNGSFNEFSNWSDAEYFMLDKPNAVCRKITSKKIEEDFIRSCNDNPVYVHKIYIVIHENTVTRFENWREAKEFIDRHPGSRYKSFVSEEEAQEFSNLNIHRKISEDAVTARISGDTVFLYNGEKKSAVGKVSGENSIEKELDGCLKAIECAVSRRFEHILIEHRNLGTEMWANGTWKANKAYAVEYQKKIKELSKKINIDFVLADQENRR